MKTVDLIQTKHNLRIGDTCPEITPNITEDCIFNLDGNTIGFYIKKIPEQPFRFLEIADIEFRSNRVPKTKMKRGTEKQAEERGQEVVIQYSTIIGSIPPKGSFMRHYRSISSVHRKPSATNFIKAMLKLCQYCEEIVEQITPEIYQYQSAYIEKHVPQEFRFSKLFTSSISNYNIAAPYHQDRANITNTVNIIVTKRKNSIGGCLNVPDYDATIEQADGSMLVYPAWANMHGVTPIIPTKKDGYRNSFVFYPLKNLADPKP